jgi:uncharacterized low-complexity protein
MSNKTSNSLGFALGAALVSSLALSPLAQAFQVTDLDQGYQRVDDTQPAPPAEPEKDKEGSCGEGKCGEDKDAEGSCGEHADEEKDKEGSCGEGKCGEGKCGGAA